MQASRTDDDRRDDERRVKSVHDIGHRDRRDEGRRGYRDRRNDPEWRDRWLRTRVVATLR
ncbi:MAG: hypothetical protein HOB37_09755 [Rhodospirillaceae bacterium]|jgi:hypothetical protein|nr:hypothetical protein [Rhodospirillaceae bacterium]MBT3908157.1 hypothetical protein [Rhodospirillaceae bacterium]MBT5300092.1 hypothetical protein [Rhodospirillaceae bacterium]MBT5513639.1 hypothetical protein [Rhodospirillaceae bacterium]MBT6087424.1 hypothetical protein [Rhodospirillaceae bacterium]